MGLEKLQFYIDFKSVKLSLQYQVSQIYMYEYIYVWKLNQTVLELDFRAVKFLFFPRRDLNSHHWYTAAPIRLALRPAP
jgi:hypothetical protein